MLINVLTFVIRIYTWSPLKFTWLSNKMAAFDVPRFNERSEYLGGASVLPCLCSKVRETK